MIPIKTSTLNKPLAVFIAFLSLFLSLHFPSLISPQSNTVKHILCLQLLFACFVREVKMVLH